MKIAIAGAGIAGLTAAIALKQAGFEVTVFEASPETGPAGAGISLSANAIKGFKKLGLAEAVAARGQFLDAFTVYDERGRIITRTDSKDTSRRFGQDNFSIHRAHLHDVLLSNLAPGELVLNKRVQHVTDEGTGVSLKFTDGTHATASCLVAANGIHSPVRKQLAPGSEPRYAGYTCWRGIIDDFPLPAAEASETWGAKGRFGIVPLGNNRVYWFACINAAGPRSAMKEYKAADLRTHFSGFHEPVPQILAKATDRSLIWGDILDIRPLQRFAFGNIVLIGDAAHATTPNMGQGACQAIEDAVVLAGELQKGGALQDAFTRFEARRIARTSMIINRSRMIGQIAQAGHPLLIPVRNFLMRLIPGSVNNRQLEKLYEVDF